MTKPALIALVLLAAAPAFAATPASPREVRIPRMGSFLEWVADGQRGVFIRGDTGRWYYARTQARCARLRPTASVRFVAPGGNLDRFGSLVVEGWRCRWPASSKPRRRRATSATEAASKAGAAR